MTGRTNAAALAAAWLLWSACAGEDEPADRGHAIRDSAGIHIVENRRPAWPEGEGWRVAPEPTVDIGVLDGAPEYQLFRVWTALTLSDGRIVVSNSGTQQLRLYDPQGLYLSTAGGPGEGPGEFERLGQAAVLPGDSVAGYDWRSRRVSLFGPDGQYGRSWRIEVEAGSGFPQVRKLMADGSVLAQIIEYGDDDTDGWQRDTAQIVIFDPAGVPADHAGAVPRP